MQAKYSTITAAAIVNVNELKSALTAVIGVAKKYGESVFEIGDISISFCAISNSDNKIEISSYIDIRKGGCMLRDERSIREIVKIIQSKYPVIQ